MSPNRWRRSRVKTIIDSLDTLSGVLVSPSTAFDRIAHRRPLALALSTATSVAIVTGLVLVPNPPELAEVMLDLPKGALSLWAVLPVWVVLFLAVLSLQAAFVHLTAVIIKARGSFTGILCGLCFAYLPGLLAAPLVMLRAVLASERTNAAYQILFPLLCLWVFILGVAAVQHTYGMTTARAVSVCSLAFVILVIFPAVMATVVMTKVMT